MRRGEVWYERSTMVSFSHTYVGNESYELSPDAMAKESGIRTCLMPGRAWSALTHGPC